MARTTDPQAYARRRDAILDAAQRLVDAKGYEPMAIQDVLDALGISKGAFYHYFDSKPALLFALVERQVDQIEQRILPIVHDPTRSALDKLLRYFAAVDEWKRAHRRLALALLRVWYADENAIVRHKFYLANVRRITPWLAQIIQQGVAEGVFTTPFPDQAARMVLCLRIDLGDAIAGLLLAEERSPPDLGQVARIAEATADALERVVGMPPGCLRAAWREALAQWQDWPSGAA